MPVMNDMNGNCLDFVCFPFNLSSISFQESWSLRRCENMPVTALLRWKGEGKRKMSERWEIRDIRAELESKLTI